MSTGTFKSEYRCPNGHDGRNSRDDSTGPVCLTCGTPMVLGSPTLTTTPSKARIYNAALKLWEVWAHQDDPKLRPEVRVALNDLFNLFEPGDQPDPRGELATETPKPKLPIDELAFLIGDLARKTADLEAVKVDSNEFLELLALKKRAYALGQRWPSR